MPPGVDVDVQGSASSWGKEVRGDEHATNPSGGARWGCDNTPVPTAGVWGGNRFFNTESAASGLGRRIHGGPRRKIFFTTLV